MTLKSFAVASPGIAALDELHRSCRAAIENLVDAGQGRLEAGFPDLLNHIEHAFRTEERWMDEIDYPALKSHREQHARVLGALHHVHGKVMDGDLVLGRHVVDDLLPQWLSLHIDTMDNALAMALCTDTPGGPDARQRSRDAYAGLPGQSPVSTTHEAQPG